MAKPLLIIAFPSDSLITESVNHHLTQIEKKLDDYHVIAYMASNITELKLEVLNAESADDLDIEKLKDEINSKINK